MGRKHERVSRRQRNINEAFESNLRATQEFDPQPAFHRTPRLNALTEAQGHYLLSMQSNQLTFGVGPAGTGKTYVAASWAAGLLSQRKIKKLIVTRPMVTAGEGAGYLPGELAEKFAPFYAPFKGVFDAVLGPGQTDAMTKSNRIEAKPLDYIRGLTFDDAFVILDEAQNTTPEQMKLFLTRIGRNCTVVVNGDTEQKDLKGISGLEDALRRLDGLASVGICEFDVEDIVRSGLVKDILRRYAKTS